MQSRISRPNNAKRSKTQANKHSPNHSITKQYCIKPHYSAVAWDMHSVRGMPPPMAEEMLPKRVGVPGETWGGWLGGGIQSHPFTKLKLKTICKEMMKCKTGLVRSRGHVTYRSFRCHVSTLFTQENVKALLSTFKPASVNCQYNTMQPLTNESKHD